RMGRCTWPGVPGGTNAESTAVQVFIDVTGGEHKIELGGEIDDVGVDELVELVLAVEGEIAEPVVGTTLEGVVEIGEKSTDGKLVGEGVLALELIAILLGLVRETEEGELGAGIGFT